MVNVLSMAKKSLLGFLLSTTMVVSYPLHAEQQFISPDLAFIPTISGNKVSIKIASGTYLYKDKISVVDSRTNKQLNIKFTNNPIVKKFPHIETPQRLFLSKADFIVNVPSKTIIQITYQGCSAQGLCYPPQRKILKVE